MANVPPLGQTWFDVRGKFYDDHEMEQLDDLLYNVAARICYSTKDNPEWENQGMLNSSGYVARFVFYDCKPMTADQILEVVEEEIAALPALKNKPMQIRITNSSELDLHGGDPVVTRALYKHGKPPRQFEFVLDE